MEYFEEKRLIEGPELEVGIVGTKKWIFYSRALNCCRSLGKCDYGYAIKVCLDRQTYLRGSDWL